MAEPVSSDQDLRATVARIEALVQALDGAADPGVRRQAQELARLLMTLYGSGLARILQILELEDRRAKQHGGGGVASLLADDLVASLLVLHDLHPHDEATRVTRGLERIRDLVGGEIVLLALGGGVARVRIDAPAHRLASSRLDVQRLIEGVIQAAAPDVVRVDIDGLPASVPGPLVQLTRKTTSGPNQPATP